MPELRVFGPPGTGKTTYMAAQVARAADRYGGSNVLVASFTRAAAAEISSRGLPIPSNMVGTLHAHCYRAIGMPEIAEKHIKEWNEFAADKGSDMTLSGGGDLDDMAEGTFNVEADEIASRYQVYRAMMRPRELWEPTVVHFATEWEDWKAENLYVDFTDMIEIALRDIDVAPNGPRIGFFDEAQDFTPLELALVRKWMSDMDFAVMAGDDDQNLYAFKGATPDAFLDPPLPDRQKRVLAQSYRVPRAVHSVAERWIKTLSRRETKEYLPREESGSFIDMKQKMGLVAPTWDRPERMLAAAQEYLDQGQEVMFLTTCSFMLDPIKHLLRDEALPFHNPYRKKRGDWNPLGSGRGISAAQRMVSFAEIFNASGIWTPAQILAFSEHLSKPKVFSKGGAEKLKLRDQNRPLPENMIYEVFSEAFWNGVMQGGIDFFETLITPAKQKVYTYPLAVLRRRGIDALIKEPKIKLGTIHSVKGGEADTVLLAPDLSRPGFERWMSTEGRDETIRQMYVGLTRARHNLLLMSNASQYFVRGIE